MNTARDAVCLALDVTDVDEATAWVARLRSRIGTFKIGLQLFCAEGPSVLSAVRRAGADRIFLDLKLHDIPNTVAGAVRALAGQGSDLLTIHTAGGRDMLAAAQAAAGEMRLLGVTVLTSLDAARLAESGHTGDPAAVVRQRARLAIEAGLTGLVCAASEVAEVRRVTGPGCFLVTPGIRLAGGELGDQLRVATPGAARLAGADLLVVGRPVLDAAIPEATVDRILADWSEGVAP